MKKFIQMLLVFFLVLPIYSNELTLNIGYWPGNLDPELEPRFFNDDLVLGTDLGRINLEWANKNTHTIYPLGIQYWIPSGNGKLMFSINWIRYAPEYRFNGIYSSFSSVGLVQLKNFTINDFEGEAGYEFSAGTIKLTPKIGGRWHSQSFQYQELTIGTVFGISIGDNEFKADAIGTYLGVDVEIPFSGNLSFIFEYVSSDFFPGFSGEMKYKTTTYYTNLISFTNQSSSYDVKIERFKIGLQYFIDNNKKIQFGIREETQTHSYPGYFNIAGVINLNGTANVGLDSFSEIVTDIVFWQQEQEQKKGLLFFAFSYGIPL